MNVHVIWAIFLRYFWLYTRHPVRMVELFFWPLVDLLVWGFLSLWLQSHGGGSLPYAASFLIGAMILWDALFRSQQGVAISFLEDVWTRNLLNIFGAPVRTVEYVAAMFLVGLARVGLTGLGLSLLAWAAYGFNLFELKVALVPFYLCLMLFGWSLGLLSVSLIMRFGHGAEALAWAVPFLFQPLVAVFYPVSALPGWLQPVALSIPATHVFEGMRSVISGSPMSWGSLSLALVLNLVWLAAGGLFFAWTLRSAREQGFLVKVTGS